MNMFMRMKSATNMYAMKSTMFIYPEELSMISSMSKSPKSARESEMIAGI